MDQMNVSMTDHLASYVRKKVKSGRYNNASEVVRDAVRRMEREEAREAQLAQSAADLLLADLAGEQRESIRRLVDRKSTRLNSSHTVISYAVFCLKKKKTQSHVLSSVSKPA